MSQTQIRAERLGMTASEYLAWHANGELWVRMIRMVNQRRRHVADCNHPECKNRMRLVGRIR